MAIYQNRKPYPPHHLMLSLLLVFSLSGQSGAASADVERVSFTTADQYLVVEVLDDDLIHFELATLDHRPTEPAAIYTSPMIFKTDYTGPSQPATVQGNVIETDEIRVEIDSSNLCVKAIDKRQQNTYLTSFCPVDLGNQSNPKGLNIDPGATQQVYGLGQQFVKLGSADGDWVEHKRRSGIAPFGNGFAGFQGAAVGNVQMPVYYALGSQMNYAVLLDNVYWQDWRFDTFWWQTRMFGDHIRWYLMTGPDLPDLRSDFMELVGRPPVPPRKAFGLWVSEFGYDNFTQIENLLSSLDRHGFPLDGFVLDLNWFGGVVPLGDHEPDPVAEEKTRLSSMGRLDWDQDQNSILATNPYSFQNPTDHIRSLYQRNISLAAIEESYIVNAVPTFNAFPTRQAVYQRTNHRCDATQQTLAAERIRGFWGIGRMIDWSDAAAGAWIHEHRRLPNLVSKGIFTHWTDLGEPEKFDSQACYEGLETTNNGRKNEHPDIHNVYNLLWNASIWRGYQDGQNQANALNIHRPRPFILTRSGSAGVQRYGAAMWSGDIASNLQSLATHMNAQMHMSFSGIDYYGADIGGFRREQMPGNDRQGSYRGYEDELYTQWFANGAWLDVPVRPHTDNEFVQVNPPYATAPDKVGQLQSNLANIRQRYELIPYYYSLAYQAHLHGAPIFPAPVFYYQKDAQLASLGHQKMVGKDIMIGIVAAHGEYQRNVYLPKGDWINYHTHEWVHSSGQMLERIPTYRGGIFRIPAFVRAGAILPLMPVAESRIDAFAKTATENQASLPFMVRVYAQPTATSFDSFEDDGVSLDYDDQGLPRYPHQITTVHQRQDSPQLARVSIEASQFKNGQTLLPGTSILRSNIVELVVENAAATAVVLNGNALTETADSAALANAGSGWTNLKPNVIRIKTPAISILEHKLLSIQMEATQKHTSVHFVCDNGVTQPGENVYVVGSIPELGNWDPSKARLLHPNIYWEYVTSPPAANNTLPRSAPVWSEVIANLPSAVSFEWKCLIQRGEQDANPTWQPGNNNRFSSTVQAGYAGQAYGRL